MTLCQKKEYQIKLHLGKQKGKKIVADFRGGQITSDAGALLLSGINQKYRITERISRCLVDQRDNRYTEYSLEDLISQRLFQIACGYEDCNDANSLRNDLLFKIITQRRVEENLASQPTLSRPDEYRGSYKELYRLAKAMIELYLDTKDKKTKKIVLDFDITADEVYGAQQLSFFHGYYGAAVYLPLLVFDGETGKLVTTILQPGNKSLSEYQPDET
ncbi:MAG: transposase, partial [Planctomycetota bacterium]|nr:transposase [Planctomycetota bacterium]